MKRTPRGPTLAAGALAAPLLAVVQQALDNGVDLAPALALLGKADWGTLLLAGLFIYRELTDHLDQKKAERR